MKTEKVLQRKIIERCREEGILCEKMESRSARGWPDLLLMYDGMSVFMEVKSPALTGRLSPAQERCAARIRMVGGACVVVDNWDAAVGVINALMAPNSSGGWKSETV